MQLRYIKRFVIVGCSGAGNTTFVRQLSEKLRIEHIELDALYWLPGWQERPKDQFRKLVEVNACKETWIFDGNYSQVQDVIWPKAEVVIWLNFPFWVVFKRIIMRTCKRVFYQERLFSDNRETFRQAFLSHDSMIIWVLKTFHQRRRVYKKLFNDHISPPEIKIELRNSREAQFFVDNLIG